jgi:hypothetical protein
MVSIKKTLPFLAGFFSFIKAQKNNNFLVEMRGKKTALSAS